MKANLFELADEPFYASLIYTLSKKEEIDDDAFGILEEGQALLTDCQYSKNELAYDITDKIPLRKYLTETLNKSMALNVFIAIVDVYCYISERDLETGYILYDSDFVLVSTETNELSFIYVPVLESPFREKPLRAYLKELLVNISYAEYDNLEYIGQIITYLNKHKQLEPFELKYFLISLMEPVAAAKVEMEEVRIPAPEPAAPVTRRPAPYLIRKSNNERVMIAGEEFKVGKIEGMADYLLDNPAVSRMHAIIRNIDNAYYICDNYSTNATYLNGERLEPGQNFLLINGAKLRFANEEFTYYTN